MSRTVAEWVGATDDTPIPPRVRLRVFAAYDGRCAKCGRRIGGGVAWSADHIVALVNAGQNRENNLQPLCEKLCHKAKTAEDVAEKSMIYKKKLKSAGIKKRQWRPLIGTRASGLRKRMNGDIVPW